MTPAPDGGTGAGQTRPDKPWAAEAEDLHKSYGGRPALKGVTLRIPRGSLFGLIGADGAGKSTLMRILATLLDADRGRVRVLGRDAARATRSIRSLIGYMPQSFSLYQDLSVAENLEFFSDAFGIGGAAKRERIGRLLAFAGLDRFRDRRAGALSGGMKQKLALSCTLIHEPDLILLDEPTIGVDPVSREEFWDMLFRLKRRGVTLLVSTPYMDEAERCDRLILLQEGGILAEGTPGDLVAKYPYRLFRIEGEKTLHYPQVLPPEGLALLYPVGGALHAAVADAGPPQASAARRQAAEGDLPGAAAAGGDAGDKDEDAAARAVLERVRQAVPEAATARPVRPGVEDVLLQLLADRSMGEA